MPTKKLLNYYKNPLDNNDIKKKLSEELLKRKDLKEKERIWVLSVYGSVQMHGLDIKKGITKLNEAELLAEKYSDNDTRLRLMAICLSLAEANYAVGNYEISEKYLLKLKELDLTLPQTPQKIQYITDYNAFYYYKGDFEKYYTEISKNLEKTIEKAKENQDKNLVDVYVITEIAYRLILLNVSILQNNKLHIDENYNAVQKLMKSNDSVLVKYKNTDVYGNFVFYLSNYDSYRKEYEKALININIAKDLAKANSNNALYFISTVEESKINFLKGDYEKSLASAKEAIKNKAFYLDFFDYEMEAYRYAALSAKKLGLNEDADFYHNVFVSKNNSLKDQHKKEVLSKVLTRNEIIESTAVKTKKNRLLKNLLYIGVGCLAVCIGFIFYYREKNRQKIERFQSIISNLEESKQKKEKLPVAEASTKSNITNSEKSKQIICALDEFEKGDSFLNKDMSLSALAAHLNTNTTTLSALINQYKKQNFNEYINGLRIDYLIEKFEADPSFRTYKLSYIADAIGFSSHPHLTKSFKNKAGMTPSEFLRLLEKNEM